MINRSYEWFPEFLHDNSQVLCEQGHVGGSLGQPRHDCDTGGVHSDTLCCHHICYQGLSHFPASGEDGRLSPQPALTLVDKLLNTDGTIPSGKNLPEIKEALSKMYFDLVTGEEVQVISSEDEETKTDRLEKKGRVKDNKFQKFYPIELELYFKYGPAVLGGEDSAYFLKEAKDIQEATVKKVSSRCTLRAKNSAELHEQAADKKGKVVLSV
jgi:hypothetical protein